MNEVQRLRGEQRAPSDIYEYLSDLTGAKTMLTEDLRQKLRQMTAEALQQNVEARSSADPCVGDLYSFGASQHPGVEWLVIEFEAAAAGRCLLVATDTISSVGTSDISVTTEAAPGRLSIRCDTGIWLDERAVREGHRSAGIGTCDLERVRRHRQLLAGEAETTAAEEEVDLDPDYVDWRRKLEEERREVCRAFGGRLDEG